MKINVEMYVYECAQYTRKWFQCNKQKKKYKMKSNYYPIHFWNYTQAHNVKFKQNTMKPELEVTYVVLNVF